MKYFFCCLLLYGGGLVLAQPGGQPALYQVHAGRESSLLEIIEGLRRTYDIDFAYPPEALADERPGAMYLSAASLEELLRKLFQNSAIQFQVLPGNRVLLRRPATGEGALQPVERLTLSGRVLDAADRQPLMEVAVVLDTLSLGVSTDEQGRFSLQVPAYLQDHLVYFHRIGYRDLILPVKKVQEGAVIRLEVAPIELKSVTILEKLPLLNPRVQGLGMDIRRRGFDAFGASQPAGADLFRAVQLLPGLAVSDDRSAGLKIRGSNADETLIILDGIPIYRADHFYGVFSSVNSAFVREVQLYKNALPIAYGGKTGGMLLMGSGDTVEKFGGEVESNLLYSSVNANVPLAGGLALSLAGRSSHTNVAESGLFDWVGEDTQFYTTITPEFTRPRVVQTQPDFHFFDLNARLLFDPHPAHRFSLSYFQSGDRYLNQYDNNFQTGPLIRRVQNQERFTDDQTWSNLGFALNYSGHLPARWNIRVNGFFTEYHNEGLIRSSLIRTSSRETRTLSFENRQMDEIRDWGAQLILDKTLAGGGLLRMGGGLVCHDNAFSLKTERSTILSGGGKATESHFFSEYQWPFTEAGRLELGLRGNYYPPAGRLYWSPRLRMSYALGSRLTAKAAFSIQNQFVREITHENRLGQSLDFLVLSDGQIYPVGRSAQYMLGATWKKAAWSFDLEFFHKTLNDVIEHASVFPGFRPEEIIPSERNNYNIFTGTGKALGMDALLSLDTRRYTGWLAYTLSKVTSRFPEIRRNEAFPARDDRRHQLKWINTLHLGQFDLSANFIYTSGRPYTDVSKLQQLNDRRDLSPADRISYLPAYQRIDLGLGYRFPIGKVEATAGCSVFNLTNHQNVKYLQYIYSVSFERAGITQNDVIGTETSLLDRTLNLYVQFRF